MEPGDCSLYLMLLQQQTIGWELNSVFCVASGQALQRTAPGWSSWWTSGIPTWPRLSGKHWTTFSPRVAETGSREETAADDEKAGLRGLHPPSHPPHAQTHCVRCAPARKSSSKASQRSIGPPLSMCMLLDYLISTKWPLEDVIPPYSF